MNQEKNLLLKQERGVSFENMVVPVQGQRRRGTICCPGKEARTMTTEMSQYGCELLASVLHKYVTDRPIEPGSRNS